MLFLYGGKKMKFIRFLTETMFVVTRKDKTLIEIPTLAFALLMLFFWETLEERSD